MTPEDLFYYSKLSLHEQNAIIDGKVTTDELKQIREEISKIYFNSNIFGYTKPQFEVFLYELVDKYISIRHKDSLKISKPIISEGLFHTEIKKFSKYLSDRYIEMKDVKEEDVKNYLLFCLNNNKTISQVRISLSQIKKYYDLMINKYVGYVFNPAANIKINEDFYVNAKKANIPTDYEISLIMNRLPEYYMAVVAVMCVKGYSHKHIKSIKMTDSIDNNFDFDIVYDEEDKAHYHFEDIKNHSFFSFEYYPSWYLNAALIFYQNIDLLADFKYVPRNFENSLHKITSALYQTGQIAEVYTAKSFRHYFIKRVYENTKDETLICKILEHSNLITTRVYLRDLGLMEQKQKVK